MIAFLLSITKSTQSEDTLDLYTRFICFTNFHFIRTHFSVWHKILDVICIETPFSLMFPSVIDNLTQIVGSTPMIKLTPQNKGFTNNDRNNSNILMFFFFFTVNILAKLELSNPTGSVKDRLAKYLLEGKKKKRDM